MYCCDECFNDIFLKQHIRDNGKPGYCDFCRKSSDCCVEPETLQGLFDPLVNLYDVIENFMPLEDLKTWDGEFLWEKLQNDWEIFSSYDPKNNEELLRAIYPCVDPKEGEPQFLHSFVEREAEYWGDDLEAASENRTLWQRFCNEIIKENRFFLSHSLDIDIIRALLVVCKLEIGDAKSFPLFRVRISRKNEKISASEMGKPPKEIAPDGRANPRGIPYLYLASDLETAVIEKRPQIGDYITVGSFHLKKKLSLVDLTGPYIDSPFKYGDKLEYMVEHLDILRIISDELSKPVSSRGSGLEYLPSQYVCELIKKEGYDGVKYRSSLSNGYNIALFDGNVAACGSTELYLIKGLGLEYEKVK